MTGPTPIRLIERLAVAQKQVHRSQQNLLQVESWASQYDQHLAIGCHSLMQLSLKLEEDLASLVAVLRARAQAAA